MPADDILAGARAALASGAGAGARPPAEAAGSPVTDRQVALVDLLDRLLNGGAVLTGDVVLSIADVDLVHINLRAVVRSLGPDEPSPW